MLEAGWEFMGHGYPMALHTVEDQRDNIRKSFALLAHTGKDPERLVRPGLHETWNPGSPR